MYDEDGMVAPKVIFFTNEENTNFNRSHNWVLSRKLFYKVGYIYDREWEYREENSEKESYMETAAHEIGHKLLEDYGGKKYSYKHKGTSSWGQNPLEGTTYPISGEIDLMKYADEEYLPSNYYERIILSSEDVLSILWLSKIEVK
ncbi:hypothetical protein ACI75Y_11340 [Capnocytophaga stomatis]|uniref:hypothetical protein n=1 Tax=Capnocytophaga stomatis TaxID=1848904 RepID=UPI00385F308D